MSATGHSISRRPAPLTNKRNVLIFLAAMALVIGWGLGNRYALALGEIYIVLLALSYWNGARALEDIDAERQHYPRAFEDGEVDVVLRLRTPRRQPVYLLEVIDTFPPAANERAGHLLRVPFSARRQYEIHYMKKCARRRGPYEIGPVHLRGADPMGLFPQSAALPLFTKLLVYPQAQALPHVGVLGAGTLFHVGQETTLRSGHSEEFIGLRDYRPGDPMSRIHWPSTARHGRFIVKEFQETVVTDVSLYVDLSRVSSAGIGDQTSTEWIIRAAASIAARAVDLSHRVEVFALAQQTDHVPMGGGDAHLIAILDRMAVYRADGRQPFTERLRALTGHVRRGATVVFVCGAAALDLEQIEGIVRLLSIQGVRVMVVPIDERRFIKLTREQDRTFAQAEPLEVIVRRLTLAGAEVFVAHDLGSRRNVKTEFALTDAREAI